MYTKKDLKTGMWVKFRDGKKAYVLLGTQNKDILSGEAWSPLNEINDDLKCRYTCERDIIEVWQPHYNKNYLNKMYNKNNSTCIYREEKETIMTISEIEEKLGISNLKVIKER